MMTKYKLYEIVEIVKNKQQIIDECYLSIDRFAQMFPGASSTWGYQLYNTFNLTAGSISFYNILYELKSAIRHFSGSHEPLWLQSWINFHYQDEVLKKHNHVESSFHGFFSIEPMDTHTVFDEYEIKNEPGLLYIGPSYLTHYVRVNTPFEGRRITVAFDVLNQEDMHKSINKHNNNVSLSFMPI